MNINYALNSIEHFTKVYRKNASTRWLQSNTTFKMKSIYALATLSIVKNELDKQGKSDEQYEKYINLANQMRDIVGVSKMELYLSSRQPESIGYINNNTNVGC